MRRSSQLDVRSRATTIRIWPRERADLAPTQGKAGFWTKSRKERASGWCASSVGKNIRGLRSHSPKSPSTRIPGFRFTLPHARSSAAARADDAGTPPRRRAVRVQARAFCRSALKDQDRAVRSSGGQGAFMRFLGIGDTCDLAALYVRLVA